MTEWVGGVDFSGTQRPAATWAAIGEVRTDRLRIDRLAPIGRDRVAEWIRAERGVARWGLDFPFGLPVAFLDFLARAEGAPVAEWAAYAAWLADRPYAAFRDARDRFCAGRPEPRRRTDRQVPSAVSCLHRGNPNLMPMTYRGIALLAGLAAEAPPSPFAPDGSARLFETYPGGTLRRLGCLVTGYKRGRDPAGARTAILDRLARLPALGVDLTPDQQAACLADDNALDAVAACLTAALIGARPDWFEPPPADAIDWPREGWMWVPDPARGGPA